MADLATARREAKWALDSFDAETGKPDFHAAELAHHLRLLLAATEPAPRIRAEVESVMGPMPANATDGDLVGGKPK